MSTQSRDISLKGYGEYVVAFWGLGLVWESDDPYRSQSSVLPWYYSRYTCIYMITELPKCTSLEDMHTGHMTRHMENTFGMCFTALKFA